MRWELQEIVWISHLPSYVVSIQSCNQFFKIEKRCNVMLIPIAHCSHQVRSWYLPPNQQSCMKVMFSVVSVCQSLCPRGWVLCDHYPWCIGSHCTGPLPQTSDLVPQTWAPLLVTLGGDHWKPVQAYSFDDLPEACMVSKQFVHILKVLTNQGNQAKFWKLFPVREIREKQWFFSQNQGKKFKLGNFFSKQFLNLLNLWFWGKHF